MLFPGTFPPSSFPFCSCFRTSLRAVPSPKGFAELTHQRCRVLVQVEQEDHFAEGPGLPRGPSVEAFGLRCGAKEETGG